ncbi:MAG TPA: M56 family metallopeptidase [Gemmatimonadaceae bacterium]|nr:M56 family metallopeptidase [Gemmatimonadaceae bacterium]
MTFALGSWTTSALVMLLVKATLLLLAALGVSALLQRASAGVRHLVWVGIVGALLILPVVVAWSPLRVAILPPATTAAEPAVSNVAPVNNPVLETASPNVEAPRSTLTPTHSPAAEQPISPWRVAATVWAVVALAVMAWLALGFLTVRRIVRRAQQLDDRKWTAPLYEIADRLGIDTTPRVMRSDEVKMPFACGLVRPTIILPAESDTWDSERRSAVLMHELAHIRRRDLLGHTLGRVACAVYWFHPLIWTAVRRLRIESERACDDLALTCGLRATNYAEHLLDIVSALGKTHTPAIAIPMAHRREFEGRMLAILDPDVSRRVGRRQSWLLLAGLFMLVVVVGGAVPVERSAPNVASNASNVLNDSASSEQVTLNTDSNASEVKLDERAQPRMKQEKIANPGEQLAQNPQQQPAPQPQNVPGVRELTDPNPDLLSRIMQDAQDTTRDDRPALLMTILRNDSSANLRRVAAWGLEKYADRAAVASALATALRRDESMRVREMAAWALGNGSERGEAVEALAEALRRDASTEVRETAAWALGQLDATRASEALGDALTSSSASPELRRVALWALGNAAPRSVPRAVLNALNDDDRGIRMLAAWVMYQSEDPETVGALEQALSREQDRALRMSYIKALGAIGERSAAALARLIDSRDPEIRAVVVEALAGKGGGPWPWPWPRPRPSP